jgi:hypothetical protein
MREIIRDANEFDWFEWIEEFYETAKDSREATSGRKPQARQGGMAIHQPRC